LGFAERWVADSPVTFRGSKMASGEISSRFLPQLLGSNSAVASGADRLVGERSGHHLLSDDGIWETNFSSGGHGRDGAVALAVRPRSSLKGLADFQDVLSMAPVRNTLLTANYVPERRLKQAWDDHASCCKAAGRSVKPRYWTVARDIVVGESDAQAEDWLLDRSGSSYRCFSSTWEALKLAGLGHLAKPDPSVADEDVRVDDLIRGSAIFGSPESVAEKIIVLRAETGFFGKLLMALPDGNQTDIERQCLSMARMARDVMPLIHD
jgi:hypothetical protein